LLKILHSAFSDSASLLQFVPFKAAEVKIYSVKHDTVITRSIEKPAKESEQMRLDIEALPKSVTVDIHSSQTLSRYYSHQLALREALEWKTHKVKGVPASESRGGYRQILAALYPDLP
jgi:hypothetical protein